MARPLSNFKQLGRQYQEASLAGRAAQAASLFSQIMEQLEDGFRAVASDAKIPASEQTSGSGSARASTIPSDILEMQTLQSRQPTQKKEVLGVTDSSAVTDADSGYSLHLGLVATGQSVVPTSSISVQNGLVYLADGTSTRPCHGVCVRAGSNDREVWFRCGGRVYAKVTARSTTGVRVYQSSTPGSLTDVYASGLQDVGQFIEMLPSSDGSPLVAVIDFDYERFGLQTDTLDSVADRGNTTNQTLVVGGISSGSGAFETSLPYVTVNNALGYDAGGLLYYDQGAGEHHFRYDEDVNAWTAGSLDGEGLENLIVANLAATNVRRTLTTNTTPVGNVLTGEDDLQFYSVDGGTLAANGNKLVFFDSGSFAANVNTKQLKVKFGATTILDTGALIFNSGDWSISGIITRTGSATQVASVTFTSSLTVLTATTAITAPTETLSGAVILKRTGTATLTNDIVDKFSFVEFVP